MSPTPPPVAPVPAPAPAPALGLSANGNPLRLVEDKPSTVKELFGSKKFMVTIVGLLATMLPSFGVNVTPEQLDQVVYLIMAFLGAQGVADAGKSYAQIKQKTEAIKANAA